MDRNPESPWNPPAPPDISAADFEKLVLEWLGLAAGRQGQNITARPSISVAGQETRKGAAALLGVDESTLHRALKAGCRV